MLAMALEKTDHSLTDNDIDTLVRDTAGFSGADIFIMVKSARALRRRVLTASKFFRIENNLASAASGCPACPLIGDICAECGATRCSFHDLAPRKLAVIRGPLRMEFFAGSKTSVDSAGLLLYDAWTRQFGNEGG